MKKFLASFLVLMMFVALLPTAAFADGIRLFNGKIEIAEPLEHAAKAYEEATGKHVEVESLGGGVDLQATLKQYYQAGNMPDIFVFEGAPDLANWTGMVVDMADQPWAADTDAGFVDESGRGARPKLSVVFQEPRLFAWMNVRRNVEIAVRHAPEPERSKAVDAALELVGLAGRDRAYPDELSGGMAQRVGLARALVGEPDILLMDEAFGALDAITRQKLYREFVAILEKRPMTVVLVTHDVTEAVMLSERVLRLAEGGVRNRWDIDLPYPRNLAMPQVGVLSEKILSEFFA